MHQFDPGKDNVGCLYLTTSDFVRDAVFEKNSRKPLPGRALLASLEPTKQGVSGRSDFIDLVRGGDTYPGLIHRRLLFVLDRLLGYTEQSSAARRRSIAFLNQLC